MSAPARNTIRLWMRFEGPLDTELLSEAWRFICDEVPGITGRLVESDGRFMLEHDPARGGLVVESTVPPDDSALNAHLVLDRLDALAALEICAESPTVHWVSLLVRHSRGDGTFTHALYSRLVEVYRAMATGRPLDARERRASRPLEEFLAERTLPIGRRRRMRAPAPAVYLPEEQWVETGLSGLDHTRLRLDREVTGRLVRRCGESAITVHGAVAAAIMRAALRARPELPAADLTSVVDVRSRVTPPIPRDEPGPMIGYVLTQTTRDEARSLRDLAARVVADAQHDSGTGVAQRSSTSPAAFDPSAPAPPMLSFTGNHLAEFETLQMIEGLEICDGAGWNEMDIRTPGPPSLTAVYGNMIIGAVFCGRLRLDWFHGIELFPEGWGPEQCALVEQDLTDFADGRDPVL